ncbi:TadE/TadG family type IV pilus assembly protein [Bowmanella pacifica]|nr:TadE family protein [Bowmanella pacifica]
MKHQQGVYSVEFALVGTVFFITLFSVLEVGRLFFTWNVLAEASRRTARLAVVCDLDRDAMQPHADMLAAAAFDNQPLVPNLSAANLKIQYLNFDGSQASKFSEIRLVRAEIINYSFDLLIPGLSIQLNSPSFSATLPRESLGVTRYGYTQCQATA